MGLVLFLMVVMSAIYFGFSAPLPKAASVNKVIPVEKPLRSTASLPTGNTTLEATAKKATLPPPKPRVPLSIKEMTTAIQKNQLCTEDNQMLLLSSDYKTEEEFKTKLYSALVAANGGNIKNEMCSLALLTRNRSRALKLSKSNSSVACLFLRALLLTNQVSFVEEESSKDLNLPEGLKILSELQQRFPSNGAYTFFKIGAYQNEPEQAEEAFNHFIKSEKFEVPLQPVFMQMHQLGQLNGTAWLHAISITSATNAPIYSKSIQTIKNIIAKQGPSLELENWLEKLHARMEKIDHLQLKEPFVDLLELASLRSIGKTYYENQDPSRRPPGFFDREKFISFFQNRVLDLTSGELVLSADEPCDQMLLQLNTAHSTHFSNREKSLELLEEI